MFFIYPEGATMGKTMLRIYDEETMRVLRRTKTLMHEGMSVRAAFGLARDEMEHQGETETVEPEP